MQLSTREKILAKSVPVCKENAFGKFLRKKRADEMKKCGETITILGGMRSQKTKKKKLFTIFGVFFVAKFFKSKIGQLCESPSLNCAKRNAAYNLQL